MVIIDLLAGELRNTNELSTFGHLPCNTEIVLLESCSTRWLASAHISYFVVGDMNDTVNSLVSGHSREFEKRPLVELSAYTRIISVSGHQRFIWMKRKWLHEKSSTHTGLVLYTNMASFWLVWNSNMAAVTSWKRSSSNMLYCVAKLTLYDSLLSRGPMEIWQKWRSYFYWIIAN